MIVSSVYELIGNTPLLKLDAERYGLVHTDIYIKLEYMNPFGSIKDRTALGILDEATRASLVPHNRRVIESSSGNTAKALQIMARMHGSQLVSVTNRVKVAEVEQMLRYLGAELRLMPGISECPDFLNPGQDNPLTVIGTMLRREPHSYVHTDQYANPGNTAIHEHTTAAELYEDLPRIDYIATGVGTAGSSGGIAAYYRSHGLSTQQIGVIADDAADFIPGIRSRDELNENELFHEDNYDRIEAVTSTQALEALDQLVGHSGVLAGPTTGASFAALLRVLREYDQPREDGSPRVAVCIACDRLESYMSYVRARQPGKFGERTHTDLSASVPDLSDDRQRLASDDTLQWLRDERALVVDVRSTKSFGMFRIAHSINVPEDMLREQLRQGMPFAPGLKLLFVCPVGERSARIAALLNERQIEAYSLRGGLRAWRQAGLSLEGMAAGRG